MEALGSTPLLHLFNCKSESFVAQLSDNLRKHKRCSISTNDQTFHQQGTMPFTHECLTELESNF